MRRLLHVGVYIAVMGVAALSYGSQSFAATTLKLAHHHAVGGSVDKAANKFAELVNEKTDGELTIRVFPGGQLGQEREAYDLMNQGGVDITITSTSFAEKDFPPAIVTTAPFVFTDWDNARALYNGEFGEALAQGIEESSDASILGYFHLGFRDLFFTETVDGTLENIKGRRMRSPEVFVWLRMFELFDTRPTSITWGEVYSAMQTGIAEGLDSPPATALDMKFDEITTHVLKTNHMFGSMFFGMNKHKLASLDEGLQQALLDAAVEAGNWTDENVTSPEEQEAYQKLQEKNLEVIEPVNIDEWRDATAPILEEIVARYPGSDRFLTMIQEQSN